jgi:2-phosphosulfolactate phosphatase
VTDWWSQRAYGVRFDWGHAAAATLAGPGACLVIVDVLAFTTAVSVVTEAGIKVFPYQWRDETAAVFARQHEAQLAAGHRTPDAAAPWTLSPAALRRAPFTPRLVLPSPNGSAIAATASGSGATVVAACLRNAGAVGEWLAAQRFGTPERPVIVIAAGERWPDGSLRPGLEDLLGAGAVLAALRTALSPQALSPEATVAAACYAAAGDVPSAIRDCASGHELTERGFAEDVAIAAEIDACRVVPVLTDGAFTAASQRGAESDLG